MKLSILSSLALAASSITVTASMVADLGYNEQVDDSDWKIQALIHEVDTLKNEVDDLIHEVDTLKYCPKSGVSIPRFHSSRHCCQSSRHRLHESIHRCDESFMKSIP
jgi:hypothetical protein